jgi:hypothetical protein
MKCSLSLALSLVLAFFSVINGEISQVTGSAELTETEVFEDAIDEVRDIWRMFLSNRKPFYIPPN